MRRNDMSDAELLNRSVRGDTRALAEILRRHSPSVTRYAWAMVATLPDVEEVVQDTFLTCWRKAGDIELPDDSLLPWLLVTCRYMAMNLNRSRARHMTDELADDLPGSADDDDARDRLRWVMAEIDKLSLLDKRVCELCLIDGRSYSEAALDLGLSVGAVRQRVSRSRDRLRKAAIDNEN